MIKNNSCNNSNINNNHHHQKVFTFRICIAPQAQSPAEGPQNEEQHPHRLAYEQNLNRLFGFPGNEK